MASGERIGEVTHFFTRICVAAVLLSQDLTVGDVVHFLGRNTDFRQVITSLQIEHESVAEAEAGQEIAVKVDRRVRRGDVVYRLFEED